MRVYAVSLLVAGTTAATFPSSSSSAFIAVNALNRPRPMATSLSLSDVANAISPCYYSATSASFRRWSQRPTSASITSLASTSSSSSSSQEVGEIAVVVVEDEMTAEGRNGFSGAASSSDSSTASSSSLQGGEEHEFLLIEHKPLGCTAEESLAVEEDGSKRVFISKVVEGGNADKAGIMVGDVIVGVSGSFDDVVNVDGLGIEKVKAYIAGRNPDVFLSIRIARGTDVMARHESALVDLCTLPEKDVNLEKCISAINSYSMSFDDDDNDDMPTASCGEDDETDCLIDQMYVGWGEEMTIDDDDDDESEAKKDNAEKADEAKRKKPAPWSSRSSPSGTFIRDPKTGKMVNIDA